MQNRRLNVDDSRGMGEALNETDVNGNGITVPATYYVQLFNTKLRAPLQRTVQQRLDQPEMYFFAWDVEQTEPQTLAKQVTEGY
jgi:hypothetical protein